MSCKGYEQALKICISLVFYITRDTQKSHQRKRSSEKKKTLVKSPRFAVLKKINLLLILFNLIVLERRNDPDLSGEPGGKATQPILNSPHCAPHLCAAYLGWPAAPGQALCDSLPTLYQGTRGQKNPCPTQIWGTEVFFGAEQQHQAQEPPIKQKHMLTTITTEVGNSIFLILNFAGALILRYSKSRPSADSVTTTSGCKLEGWGPLLQGGRRVTVFSQRGRKWYLLGCSRQT